MYHTVQLLSTLYTVHVHCFRIRVLGIVLKHEVLYMFVKLCVTFYEMDVKLKLKQSRNRPGVAQRFPGG